jgi:DNA repair ATPase RecN
MISLKNKDLLPLLQILLIFTQPDEKGNSKEIGGLLVLEMKASLKRRLKNIREAIIEKYQRLTKDLEAINKEFEPKLNSLPSLNEEYQKEIDTLMDEPVTIAEQLASLAMIEELTFPATCEVEGIAVSYNFDWKLIEKIAA